VSSDTVSGTPSHTGSHTGFRPHKVARSSDRRVALPTFICTAAFSFACISRLLVTEVPYGILALLALLHAIAYRKDFLRTRISLPLVSFALFGVTSVAWAVHRSTTLQRLPSFLSFYILASIVGPAVGVQRLSEIFTRVTRIFVFVGLVAGYSFPEWAKDPGIPGETGWSSIVASKNYLGLLGVLCFACSLLAPRARRRVIWAALSVLLVVESRSATSLALVIFTAGSAVFSWIVQRFDSVKKRRLIVGILGFFGLVSAASVALDATFAAGLLGRDATLTGRTAIWDFVWARIKERPWFGHGYQTYWTVQNEFTINVKRTVGFPVSSAHQGLLDILLSVGIIGAAIMVVLLATTILRTFGDRSILGRPRTNEDLMKWARGIVLIYVIETFSESCLTNVFVVPLLMVVGAVVGETTLFRHRIAEQTRAAN
jgi:exopolysaccharide production protein ExoQ